MEQNINNVQLGIRSNISVTFFLSNYTDVCLVFLIHAFITDFQITLLLHNPNSYHY